MRLNIHVIMQAHKNARVEMHVYELLRIDIAEGNNHEGQTIFIPA